MRPVACLAALLLVGLAACGGGRGRPELVVAAASDLRFAFAEVARAYEGRCDCDVVLSFGSSGNFATQIEQGLPVDIFASASERYIEQLAGQGLVVPETRRLYGLGRIVLAAPADAPVWVTSLEDLRDPTIRRVAIANPQHAPYGEAAREALRSAGLWDELQDKLVLGENASQALEFVETGNAQAGLVPLALAVQRETALRFVPVDEALYTPLRQEIVVLRHSDEQALARDFITFLESEDGRAIMRRYGFFMSGEEASP